MKRFPYRMPILSILTLLCFVAGLLTVKAKFPSEAYTIQTVPNPKSSPSWNYVSNPGNVLSETTVSQINSTLKDLEDSTTCQVAVVVLNSIGKEIPHDFGVDLFEYWGIGRKNSDNGLLILLVMDQRAMEFITGKGTEGVLTDALCGQIMDRYMVPYAKEGNFDQAVINGVTVVSQTLKQPAGVAYLYDDSTASPATTAPGPPDLAPVIFFTVFIIINGIVTLGNFKSVFRNSKKEYIRNQDRRYYTSKVILLNIAAPLAFLIAQFALVPFSAATNILFMYGWFIAVNLEKRLRLNRLIEHYYSGKNDNDVEKYHALKKSNRGWIFFAFIMPLPFLFYHFALKKRLSAIRNNPRSCPRCSHEMKKSNEEEDDAYLKSGERLEEQIRSSDYDVWKCVHCAHIIKLLYVNSSSKYGECPICKTRAFYERSRETVVSPSYSSSGEGLAHSECLNCHYKVSKKYSIAKLVRSSSSGSGGSGGSSGGGSSFGGGSTGGGGAGRSW